MENCLFKGLNEDVNNSNLKVLGQMKFHINSASGYRYLVIDGSNGKITCSNGYQIDQGGAVDVAVLSSVRCGFLAGNYDILVSNKYNITRIAGNTANPSQINAADITFNLDDLKYADGLTEIWHAQYPVWISGGSLSSLTGKQITKLKLHGAFTGNINTDVNFSPSLTHLYLFNNNGGLVGNINSLVLPNTVEEFGLDLSTGVIGEVKTFAEAQNRTSGTMSVHGNGSGITYDGSAIAARWIDITFTANGPEYSVR